MTTPLFPHVSSRAVRRARARRARERGAVIFIVAMTLAVLASLGLFAMVSASTEVRTAGYERQSLQTHYLQDNGLVATTGFDPSALTTQMNAQTDYALSSSGIPRHHCVSLEAVPDTADHSSQQCKILRMTDLTASWQTPYNTTPLRPSSITTPGSLGAAPLDGYFTVEVTDPVYGQPTAGNPVAGYGQSVCTVTMTVTSYGATYPNNSGTNTTQKYASEGLEQGRGRLTSNGVPCP